VQSVLSHDGNQLANAVVANIRAVARSLTGRSPVLQKSVAARKLKIVGARYSLSSGVVSIVS
jgi:carbonic anhydrase